MKKLLLRRTFLGTGAALLAPLAACGDDDSNEREADAGQADQSTDLSRADQGGREDLGIDRGIEDVSVDAGDTSTPMPARPGPPEALVGYGAETTGGRGGRVVVVTSLSRRADDEGSIRWALNQHRGEPLYIVLAVEGTIALRDALEIDRPNVTLDGRFAPGAGCWFEGARLEVEADNVFLESVRHFGNDPRPVSDSSDADCIRWGIFNRDTDSRDHVFTGYVRRCEFHHGNDEIFGFNARGSNQSSGNRVGRITVERSILANASGLDHEFAIIVGDGAEELTFYRNLVFNCAARYPFVRRFAERIEFINNAAYNFNENCVQVLDDAQMNLIGGLLRLGPRWRDVRGPILLARDNRVFVDDIRIDSPLGRTNSHGLYRTGVEGRSMPTFEGSGLVAMDSSEVADAVAEDCGARLYGGVLGEISQDVVDQFIAGDAPDRLVVSPGPTPRNLGAEFPAHDAFVPRDYLEAYPDDTSLERQIDDGGPWDGYMVAERVGAWLTSAS